MRTVSNIGQKGFFFLELKGPKCCQPLSIPFLSVLCQNKALHNLHKMGQCPIAEHIFFITIPNLLAYLFTNNFLLNPVVLPVVVLGIRLC